MSSRVLLATLLLSVPLLAPAQSLQSNTSAGRSTDTPTASSQRAITKPAVSPARSTAAAGSAAEAMAFLIAVDEFEVAAATQARGRKLDPAIAAYADMLLTDHRNHLTQTRAIAHAAGVVPVDTADVQARRTSNRAQLAQMAKTTDDADYGSGFIDAMATSHADVLDLIDKRLNTFVTDDRLKAHLQATRIAVATHLEHAQELQSASK